jgi:hypothetical protein
MSVAERFDALREAVIDASSIIYMLKSGFLGLLGSTLTLKTLPEVAAETGWPVLPVTVVGSGAEAPGGLSALTGLSNDERLLDLAATTELPLISEDRALLRAAGEEGLEYYNSLMMLAFLQYRGRIDPAWFEESLRRLLEVARYGEDVLARFREIRRELGL